MRVRGRDRLVRGCRVGQPEPRVRVLGPRLADQGVLRLQGGLSMAPSGFCWYWGKYHCWYLVWGTRKAGGVYECACGERKTKDRASRGQY